VEEYKSFFISGKAGLVHAFSPKSYVAGAIYKQGRGSSIEEVTRFALPSHPLSSSSIESSGGVHSEVFLDHRGIFLRGREDGVRLYFCDDTEDKRTEALCPSSNPAV
jgi:hypothetical protein